MVKHWSVFAALLLIFLCSCSDSDHPPTGTSLQAVAPAPLSVTKTGNGTVTSSPAGINCGGTCEADFPAGTSVTLTAVPTSGSTFAGWTDGCTGMGSCVLVMQGPQTVTASFAAPAITATLTVASVGTGSGTITSSPGGIANCAATCTATVMVPTTVTLTGVPANGSALTGWSANGCSGAGPCAVVVNADQTVTAIFTKVLPVMDLTIFGSSHGLNGPVIDGGPDEGGNIWAATPDALYVLRAGQTTFKRFTATEGLRIQTFTDSAGQPSVSHITAIAAGKPGEVFVGYRGYEGTIPPPAPPRCCVARADFSDPRWSLGQADKITLDPEGAIQALRYEFRCDLPNCWEESSVRRMLFAHQGAATGHLFVGFDHGVAHVFNDIFGDHIHIQTWWHYPDGTRVQQQGEQYGLFVLPTGELLSGAINGVGLFNWNPDPKAWVRGSFRWVFTTYGTAEPFNAGAHTLDVSAGYREDQRGVAMTSDGTAWFASATRGLGSYNDTTARGDYNRIQTYTTVPGLPASGLMDLAADPDDTLWIVDGAGRLLRFNPATLSVQAWPGIAGARRVVMDTTVVPRAVYVSMGNNGLAVIRAK